MNNADLLRIFVKVGELGSISGAARALQIPKATVSRAVARLERRHDVALIERTTRSVVLTEIGCRLHERCVRLAADIAAIDDEIALYRGEPSGILRVGCPSYVSSILAPHLPRFLSEHPAIDLRMKVADRLLPNPDGFDVVLHVGWLADSNLVARKLRDVPLTLVASPDYLGRATALDRPGDLVDHAVIGAFFYADAVKDIPGELPARLPELQIGSATDRHPLSKWHRFLTNDQGAVIEMAVQGAAMVATAEILVRDHLRSGRLVRVLPECTLGPTPALYAVYTSRASAPPKVRAFADFVGRIASSIFEA